MVTNHDYIQCGKKLSSQAIIAWLKSLRMVSYAPSSDYTVSAVVEVKGKREFFYFSGVNVENFEHALVNHAEESAIGAMVTALGKGVSISAVWVMGGPQNGIKTGADYKSVGASCCGRCRQCISGFAAGETNVNSVSLSGDVLTHTIGELLPYGYSWKDLPKVDYQGVQEDVVGLIEAKNIYNNLVRAEPLDQNKIFEWLNGLSPIDYLSKIEQSAVILLDNGFYVAGVRVEDAPYTGFNAVQAALGNAVTAFGRFKIKKVWSLSKAKDATVLPQKAIQPLSLSALQVLNGFSENKFVPVTLFASNGDYQDFSGLKAAQIFTSFDQSFIYPTKDKAA